MMRVLVTGASGFVGRALCGVLANSGYHVRAALRSEQSVVPGTPECVYVGNIGSSTDWSLALEGIDAVVHLAARAHVLGDTAENANLYTETNALGTRGLAEAAVQAGIRRFIHLSSIKVNGEETTGHAYTCADEPRPTDPYGKSKLLAEQMLGEVAASSGMQVASVRSPLVYGPGVRANFLRLMRWVDLERLLPFGAIDNRRSMICIWNLCDVLVRLLKGPIVPDVPWLVSDGEDLATPEIIRRMGVAMNRRTRLWPVPVSLLRMVGIVAGKQAELRRLCGSLRVDISRTRRELEWTPPMTVDEALSRTVRWYLSEGRSSGV